MVGAQGLRRQVAAKNQGRELVLQAVKQGTYPYSWGLLGQVV
jgi:hypothetical protein